MFIGPDSRQLREIQAFGMNGGPPNDHHSCPSLGPCHEIFLELVRNEPLFIHTEVDTHGGHNQPVLYLHAPNRYGGEEMP